MLAQALTFLLETVLGLYSLALLLRFYLQVVRAPYRNPVSHFIAALTDCIVVPARRFIPGLWGMDLATLVLAWLAEFVLLYGVLALSAIEPRSAAGIALAALAFLAVLRVIKLLLYILMVAVVVQAILSWVNPYSPIAPLLNSMALPFLRPLRKRIPPIGNVDVTPLVLIVVIQLILIVPVQWLEFTGRRLF